MKQELLFRPMRFQDIPAVLEMESESCTYPWSETALRQSVDAGHHCVLCQLEEKPKPVAYTVSTRVLDECSLLNICVSRSYQGRGIGRAMLNELIRHEKREGTTRVFLEVRESNVRAIGLYESLGFTCQHVRRGYYPANEQRENARVYTLDL